MVIGVIERDYSRPERFQDRYIGAPCANFEEARELVFAHTYVRTNNLEVNYVEDGVFYTEINRYTGEVVREYFVKVMVS